MYKWMAYLTTAALCFFASTASAVDVPLGVDTNADPDIFEMTMTAEVATLDLDGNGMMVECWTFNGTRPGPEIRVKVGDMVIVHLVNQLTFPTSIHWHGIEVNNAADGTSVTQKPVMPGESFTYQFVVPRPGVFYYHPHMRPMNQVWKGMYGSVVVTDSIDDTLTANGVLPQLDHSLIMSDVTVAQPIGSNDAQTFPNDPTLPWAGGDSFFGNTFQPTPMDLVESIPRAYDGTPSGGDPVAAGTIPFIAPARDCRDFPEIPCRTNEGQLVLGNGRIAAPRAGSPDAPGAVKPAADALRVASGRGVRLRMLNAAVQRYFRLRATDGSGNQLPLYRIGGEGGLLNEAILEGGIQGTYDTKYDTGEIVLAPSQRADVVLIADAVAGDVITLWTLDFQRTGFGWALVPTVPVMHIVVDPSDGGADTMSVGTPLRTDPAIADPVEDFSSLPLGSLLDPATLDFPQAGSPNPVIRLTNQVEGSPPYPSIDNVRGAFEGGGASTLPYAETARWVRVGELIEFVIRNETNAHHPWHHHGFSFQPIRLEQLDGTVMTNYPPEFVDVVDVPGFVQIVYRMRIEDRVQADGSTTGGAIGRWLFHCHLFHHAALGMITELVVLPPCTGDSNADGDVDIDDLLSVIQNTGTSFAAADMNLNGTVNIDDLVEVIQNFGPCPETVVPE
ncbi:MAG: multicopper oxidase domain-containing protein [Planctomycetota bacterium]